MTRTTQLSDALIARALAADPRAGAPAGLLASISADVRGTPQRRRLPSLLPGLFAPGDPQTLRRLTLVAAVAALVVMLLGTLLLAGGGRRLPPLDGTLPYGAGDAAFGYGTNVVAIDAGEAWMASSVAGSMDSVSWLWHHVEGRWTKVDLPQEPFGGFIRAISVSPDGSVALATDAGVWVRRDDAWTRAWSAPAMAVAWTPDGRLLAGTPETTTALAVLREEGDRWVAESAGCGTGSGLAVDRDGDAWTTGNGYTDPAGIERWDGASCREVFPRGDGVSHAVLGVAADPRGGIAISLAGPLGQDDDATYREVWHWDGTSWERLGSFETMPWRLHYRPDGSLWMTMMDGLFRLDGATWRRVADTALGSFLDVPPDGTIWYQGPQGIERIPAWETPG